MSATRRDEAPTRRRFLQVGVAGGAALAVAGWLAQSPPRAAAGGALEVLSPEEYAIVAAVAARLCPGGPGLPSAAQIDVAAKVDRFLAGMDDWTIADFKSLLAVFDSTWGGLLLEGRISRFVELSPAEQDETLESWRRSSLDFKRGAYTALRGLIVTRYWGDPRVYGFAGYPGPPSFGRKRN